MKQMILGWCILGLLGCAEISPAQAPSAPRLMIPDGYAEAVVLDIDGKTATYYTFNASVPAKITFAGPLRLTINLRPIVQTPGAIVIFVKQDESTSESRKIEAVPSKLARFVSKGTLTGTPGEKRELRFEFEEGEHTILLGLPQGSNDVVSARFFEDQESP